MALIRSTQNADNLLYQMRYTVLSNINDNFPYYICTISNQTYNNFRCCFSDSIVFSGNRYDVSSSNNIEISYVNDTYYNREVNRSCNQPYQNLYQSTQLWTFTNVGNNDTGLIDIIADTRFPQISVSSSSSGSSSVNVDLSSLSPYLLVISCLIILIILRDFIKSIFKLRG